LNKSSREETAAPSISKTAYFYYVTQIVTDTYEHADRLQSYRQVADVATTIEANPTVAVGA
jgi:hypothetical protein